MQKAFYLHAPYLTRSKKVTSPPYVCVQNVGECMREREREREREERERERERVRFAV